MSWDSDNFPGLIREFTGADPHVYGLGTPPDEPDHDLGNHACTHKVPNPSCPNEGEVEVETTTDLVDARYIIFGDDPVDQSLLERALYAPPPAFVQIAVQAQYGARGGNNGCPLVGPTDCLDNVDGELHFEAVCGAAAWEAGGDETVGTQDLTLSAGFIDSYFYTGMLRRELDGDSYAGDPTNDASRTLIPWAEFIADPMLTITATAQHVNRLFQQTAVFTVTPWFAPVSRGRVWVIGSV